MIYFDKINILDPTMMTEMLKNNISNMVPMIVIGGVINWAFSGFLCSMYFRINLKINYFSYLFSKSTISINISFQTHVTTWC